MCSKKTALGVIIVLFISIIFASVFILRDKPALDTLKNKDLRIPQGKQNYTVQQGENAKPRILAVSIDPPDVRVGYIQTLSITIDSESNNIVTTETQTDHKAVTLALGLAKEDGNKKTYEGSWKVEDTHDATYHTTFIARDGDKHENKITIAWTDPCGIQPGGDWTMTGDCTISGTDGVDNGDATIQSGTLTLNAPFVFNSGKALTITGGAILMGTGAEIRKDNLWQIDADADGYPADGSVYAQTNAPANGRRRNLLQSSTDCYDSNASANPGVGTFSYFTTNRGDGSYDYNCDGIETKQASTTAACFSPQVRICNVISNGLMPNSSIPSCGAAFTRPYTCLYQGHTPPYYSPSPSTCLSGHIDATASAVQGCY